MRRLWKQTRHQKDKRLNKGHTWVGMTATKGWDDGSALTSVALSFQ